MPGLLKAEWLKITRQGTSRLLALILLGLAGMIPLFAVVNVVQTGAVNFRQENYARLGFPNAILAAVDAIGYLGVIVVIVLIGSVIGSEYGLDTWKNLLIRQPGRSRFLTAKLLIATVGLLLAFALAIAATQLLASIGHLIVDDTATKVGLSAKTLTGDQFFHDLFSKGGPQLLYLVVCGALTTMFTIIARSTVAGIMLTLAWWIGENVSQRLMPDFIKNLTVFKNISSLQANLNQSGSGEIQTWQSLLLIGAVIIIPLAIALVFFDRRDMAG
jgi:ABC-type transport system involved in multi-copper enzyme maturation permease subunit